MARPHRELKILLASFDLTQGDMAKATGRSLRYINDRMNDKYPWSTDDIYLLRDFFNGQVGKADDEVIPLERIFKFFPPRQSIGVRSS